MPEDYLTELEKLEKQVTFLTNQNALRIIENLTVHEVLEELMKNQRLMAEYLRTKVARKLELEFPPMN